MTNATRRTIRCRVTPWLAITVVAVAVAGAPIAYAVEVQALGGRFALALELPRGGQGDALRLARRLQRATAPAEVLGLLGGV